MADYSYVRRCGLIVLAALFGCDGGTDLTPFEGDVGFVPDTLDFGETITGQAHELPTELINTGADARVIQNITFDPPETAFAARTVDGAPVRGTSLRRNQRLPVRVLFVPIEARRYDTTMRFVFEDEVATIEMSAFARDIVPAGPELSPTGLVFASTGIGQIARLDVQVKNVGEAPGALTQIKGLNPPFSVRNAIDGTVIQLPSTSILPGGALGLSVEFRPSEEGIVNADLELTLDSGESARLSLSGQGRRVGELICGAGVDFGEVPRGQFKDETIRCTPAGGPYQYGGVEFIPPSSDLFTVNPNPTIEGDGTLVFAARFIASGLLERHLATLEIKNELGGSTTLSLAGTTGPAVPGSTDLRTVLRWNTLDSDFDIHLVRNGGNPFEERNDCHFESRSPDWGTFLDPADDPYLDFDNIQGFGPEEINIATNAEASPSYDVYVQYHNHTRPDSAPRTTVTVEYGFRTQPTGSISRDIFECGSLWHVGRYRFQSGQNPWFEIVDRLSFDYQADAAEKCQ